MNEPGLKFGLLYGMMSIIITMMVYFISTASLFSMYFPILIGALLSLPFMHWAVLSLKRSKGEEITFGEANKPAFLTYVIGSLLFVLFNYLLVNYGDQSLIELQFEAAKDRAGWMGEMMNADPDAMQQMIKDMEAGPKEIGISGTILQWLTGIIFPGILVSILISVVSRRF